MRGGKTTIKDLAIQDDFHSANGGTHGNRPGAIDARLARAARRVWCVCLARFPGQKGRR